MAFRSPQIRTSIGPLQQIWYRLKLRAATTNWSAWRFRTGLSMVLVPFDDLEVTLYSHRFDISALSLGAMLSLGAILLLVRTHADG